MKRILAEEDLPATGEFRPAAILGAISRAKNEMLDETFLAENAVNHRERVIAKLAKRYRERLEAARALDFDDLLLKAVELFDAGARRAGASTRRAGSTSTSTSTRTRTGRSTCGSGRSPPPTATCASWATTTSRSTAGAARTSRTSSTSSATTRTRRSSSSSRTTARRSSSSTRPTRSSRATSGGPTRSSGRENQGGVPIQRFEAFNEDEEAEWIARQIGGPDRADRARLVAHPARRRRRDDPVPAQGRRRHVPDERPVPRDRGVVPPLRHPLPARRRHAVLPAARGQGRAGVPAGAPLGHRRRVVRADHQRPGPRHRRQERRGAPALGRRSTTTTCSSAVEAAARGEVEGIGPRIRTSLGEFAALVRAAADAGRRAAAPRAARRRSSSSRATGRCSPTAPRRARTAGRTCSSCGRSRPATTTCRRTTRSTGCSRRPRSSPTRTRTRARPTR